MWIRTKSQLPRRLTRTPTASTAVIFTVPFPLDALQFAELTDWRYVQSRQLTEVC